MRIQPYTRDHRQRRAPAPLRPQRFAIRADAPTPVCDGCHAARTGGEWHAGDDGAQYCAACHAVSIARVA